LKEFLKEHQKVVILGIGNDMKGDDAVGTVLAQKLSKMFPENDNITVFDGKTVPENFTGAIRRKHPSHIILVDAVAMPLSFFIKYLKSTCPAELIIVGIQPKNISLVNEMSVEVENSVEILLKLFTNLLQ